MEFLGPFLPVGRNGPYRERLREQFKVVWQFHTGVPVEGAARAIRRLADGLQPLHALTPPKVGKAKNRLAASSVAASRVKTLGVFPVSSRVS